MIEKKTRQMPKGGRKGGAVFPRVALSDALLFARKLVSKTHTSAQPQDVILTGVMGSKGGTGRVRMSALKQYGLLKGDVKAGFAADELAKLINSAPDDELLALYQKAILKPTVFRKLFDTFHGDTVTRAKLKQRAADLKVHPDEAETCAELYVAGMLTAGLVNIEDDRIVHKPASALDTNPYVANEDSFESAIGDDTSEKSTSSINGDVLNIPEVPSSNTLAEKTNGHSQDNSKSPFEQLGPRAVFNVNVTLDSSLDIEKLQKQLELLKRFGAI